MGRTNGKEHDSQLPSLENVLDASAVDQLKRKSDYEGFKFLAFHLSTIFFGCVCVYLTEGQGVMGCAARLFLAYVYSFLYMPLHETVHETAFKTKRFNTVVMWITAFLTARPPTHFRCFHWAHHKHTGNRSKDPELSGSIFYPDLSSNWFLQITGIPFWLDRFCTLIRHALSNVSESYLQCDVDKIHSSLVFEARLFCALFAWIFYAFVLGHPIFYVLCRYWLEPSLIGQINLRLFLIAEHHGCSEVQNILSNTRSTSTTWWVRMLAWNMTYHIEHHGWPNVPSYNLPKLHKMLKDEVAGKEEEMKIIPCNPKGDVGYIMLNVYIFRKLFLNFLSGFGSSNDFFPKEYAHLNNTYKPQRKQ